MKPMIRLACVVLLQALTAFNASYAARGDVIVQFRDDSPKARQSQAQTVQRVDAQVIRKIANHGHIQLVKPTADTSMNDLLQRLRSDPAVLYAEPDVTVQIPDPAPDKVLTAAEATALFGAAGIPNDRKLTWGYQDIEAHLLPPEPGQAPLVAVIDTGVDYTHIELTGRVILGHDYVNNDDDPMDDHGHGTHVSGIIAATANNRLGSAGISPQSSILALKVLDANGSGFLSDVIAAIRAAADHPDVRVLNLSLGSASASRAMLAAIRYAAETKGKLVALAAGNSDTNTPFYPASYAQTVPGVIGVAANEPSQCKAWFSNYGVNATIAAPGLSIVSTLPGNRYASWSGTSMATPFVAGAAARLLADNPGTDSAALEQLLENSGDVLTFDSSCWPMGDHFSHLNLFTAWDAGSQPPLDSTLPQLTIESPVATGNYETDQATLDIAGSANDDIGVTKVTWSNDRGGSGEATGTTAWTITALPLQEGANIVTVTAHDAAGNQSAEQLQVVFTPSGTATLTLQIGSAADDGYELLRKGKTVLLKKKLIIGRGLLVGYRFDQAAIPANAVIVSATLSQYGFRSGRDVTVGYRGEVAANAAPFTGNRFDLSARAKTLESVTDHLSAWQNHGYRQSPDLSAVLQEIVSGPEWQSGNAIALFVTNEGSRRNRVVMPFERNPSNAATLEIRYRLP